MLRAPTESLPQRLVVTLLADYRQLLAGPIPSSDLVNVLQEFDVAPEASRSAIARLVHRGLLERFKVGRETLYAFSAEGERYVQEDQQRILEFGQPRPWDGEWTLVLFSIAESERHKRHAIKTRFRALGFAPLYDAAWIAAYATPEQASIALREAEVDDADILRASFAALPGRLGSLHEKWEVAGLLTDYESFIEMFGPLSDEGTVRTLSPAASLIARTRLMDAWRTFPRREPDLPAEHLPPGWPLPRARALFTQVYEALRPSAEARLTDLLSDSRGS